MNELIFIFLFSAAVPQRPQPQVSDRRQIDDMEANNARSNSTTSPATAARGTTANVSTDELGPLPPGWQMSRTDSDRLFFIDHINKRTTWVKTKKIIKKISAILIFIFDFVKVDPRTGKPSAQPVSQRELKENGPLPVIKTRLRIDDYSFIFF